MIHSILPLYLILNEIFGPLKFESFDNLSSTNTSTCLISQTNSLDTNQAICGYEKSSGSTYYSEICLESINLHLNFLTTTQDYQNVCQFDNSVIIYVRSNLATGFTYAG